MKELAAAREHPRGCSCIQSSDSHSQKEPGFGDVTSTTAEVGKRPHRQKWGSDHPSLLHKLAENSAGPNQGQVKLFLCYEGASKMPHEVQQQPDNDLTYIIPQHQHSNDFRQSCPYGLHLPPAMLVQSMAAPQSCSGQSPTDRQHPGFS